VIYISHRLDEIFELGDYVTVMRDGRHIDTKPMSEVKDRSELIKMMIGKTVFEQYTPKERDCDDIILQARNLSNHKLQDVSFDVVRARSSASMGSSAQARPSSPRHLRHRSYTGTITFKGKPLTTPRQGDRAGIALVPEERRSQGLFTILTIRAMCR